MSTGNDNFITLDNISEIQDIVNGDYMFTISNGIIYKLDFQNFIISRENTDFFTTIDTLSAQVVSNTQSLCAINAYINENKNNLSGLIGLSSTFTQLSSGWQSNYNTTKELSGTSWLPQPTESEPFETGALIYYDGGTRDWKPIQSGVKNNVLLVDSTTGLPAFGGGDSLGSVEVISEGLIEVYNNPNLFDSRIIAGTPIIDLDVTRTLANITERYSYVQINYVLLPEIESVVNGREKAQFTSSKVQLFNNNTPILYTIQNGNTDSGLPMSITANITGIITAAPYPNPANRVVIKLQYTISGIKTL